MLLPKSPFFHVAPHAPHGGQTHTCVSFSAESAENDACFFYSIIIAYSGEKCNGYRKIKKTVLRCHLISQPVGIQTARKKRIRPKTDTLFLISSAAAAAAILQQRENRLPDRLSAHIALPPCIYFPVGMLLLYMKPQRKSMQK